MKDHDRISGLKKPGPEGRFELTVQNHFHNPVLPPPAHVQRRIVLRHRTASHQNRVVLKAEPVNDPAGPLAGYPPGGPCAGRDSAVQSKGQFQGYERFAGAHQMKKRLVQASGPRLAQPLVY